MSCVAHRRLLWLLLVLPGFLLRALVAPGFMPMAGTNDSVTMQVCPGHAAAPSPSNAEPATAPPVDDEPKEADPESPCAFAVTAGSGPTAASIPFLAAGAPDFFLAASPAVQAPFAGHAPRQFPPRGPPLPRV
jgi:hypothetical protein